MFCPLLCWFLGSFQLVASPSPPTAQSQGHPGPSRLPDLKGVCGVCVAGMLLRFWPAVLAPAPPSPFMRI